MTPVPARARRFPRALIILALTGALLGLSSGTAQCATIHAPSCSQQDVQAAIDGAAVGDVVVVPAGTATWTTPETPRSPALRIAKGITLKGAGMDQTVITDGTVAHQGHEVLIRARAEEGQLLRITGFAFVEVNDSAIVVEGTCKQLRIDHCRIAHKGIGYQGTPTCGSGVIVYGHTYGVIDHCEFTNVEIGVASDGNPAWERPLTLATQNAIYVEDCTFGNTSGQLDDLIDGNAGARYVFRHNTSTNLMMHCHGPGGGEPRGTHSYEFYENKLTYAEPVSGGSRIGYIRGGTGVIFNNTAVGNWWHIVIFWDGVYKPERCVGKYPCLDQVGRTTDHDKDGVQDLVPLFAWNNKRVNYSDKSVGDTIDLMVQDDHYREMSEYNKKGRDFYVDTVTYDPDTGVYSATYADDDGAVKTWTYKPYTYPHPLTKME